MGAVKWSVAALASLLVGCALLGSAATWTVGPGGPPTYNFAHPQDAVNAASPGDTILVYPGTYGERVFTSPVPPHWGPGDQYAPALIVWKDNLTIQAVDPTPGATVIQTTYDFWVNAYIPGGGGGGSIEHSTGGVWNPATKTWDGPCVRPKFGTPPNAVAIIASGVTLQGFTIRRPVPLDGSKGSGYNACSVMIGGLYAGYGGAGETLGYGNNTIRNCTFRDTWMAVYIWHSSGNIIENNTVEALGNTGHWVGIQIYDGYNDAQINLGSLSQNNVIRGNTIADKGIAVGAWAPSINTDNSGTKILNNIVASNIRFDYTSGTGIEVSGNTLPGQILLSDNLGNASYTSVTINNNTVNAGGGNGIQLHKISGGTVSGNTVSGRTTNGIALLDSRDVAVQNNTTTGNGAAGITLVRTTNLTVTGNTIRNNAGNAANPAGLTIREGTNNTTVSYNDILNNTQFGIWIKSDAGAGNVFWCNNISGNGFGMQNNLASVVDGRFNWWGHPTGPSGGATDPVTGRPANGTGDKVSANIQFDPWLNAPCPGGVAAGSGDVNADGQLNILDAELVYKAALGLVTLTPAQATAADVNGDGVVDQTDAEWIAEALICLRPLPTCPCCP